MKAPSSNGASANSAEGEKKIINSELWHACAGPLVSLPPVGSLVVYFPQGHSEQVAASMHKEIDSIPSYPNLPSKLICRLHSSTLLADLESDEVYAQMTLQPVNKYDREAMLASEMGLKQNKQPAEFFCKTLTASDTSTHGGFSVPRRAAEKIFPPLDFTMQPPAQELVAKDLHDSSWKFRHIYRGQPKRHLLTTGWSVFVSTKRLIAGDSVLFIRMGGMKDTRHFNPPLAEKWELMHLILFRDEKSQLLLGIRRANRQQPALSSSVLSSDSMHIGLLAAAAHAAQNNSQFTIFYNPRASPSEFVIPLAKYNKALYTQVSLGMRFRMLFETEDSSVRRYMGTITGISDLDPVRWKNSHWRNLQVGWDESTTTERRTRVSLWEIEPVATPFYICPPPIFRPKFPKQPGAPDDESEVESAFRRVMPWLSDDFGLKDIQSAIFPGMSLVQWMAMQQQQTPGNLMPSNPQNFQSQGMPIPNLQFSTKPVVTPQSALPNEQQLPPQHQVPAQQQVPVVQQQPQLQNQVPLQLPNSIQIPNSIQMHPQLQRQQMQLHQQQQQLQQLEAVEQQKLKQNLIMGPTSNQVQQHEIAKPNNNNNNNNNNIINNNNNATTTTNNNHIMTAVKQQSALPQVLQNQLPVDYQQALLQSQQLPQLSQLSQQEIQQIQLLQKYQQQQQQILSQLNPQYQSQVVQQVGQKTSEIHLQQNNIQQLKAQQLSRSQSCPNTDPPPTVNSLSRGHQGSANLTDAAAVAFMQSPVENFLQEIQSKPDSRLKPNRNTVTDLDASSASSFCLDDGPHQDSFSMPAGCLDGSGVQIDTRDNNNNMNSVNNINSNANSIFMDGLMPDALMARGVASGKEVENLYSGKKAYMDVETEISTADISSQSFGLPDISFKPGCSSDVGLPESGMPSQGMWNNNQTQRRTFTKVQKRGSVGRSIDVTRYRGYDELRHDLACMFGIQGQLEDPYRTDWKLVYVDHENDILLVGDDPWEEFVSCVKSIKILSAAEVQQMSLEVDLGNIPVQNQACSGSDEGNNAWRGMYDDTSGASYHR